MLLHDELASATEVDGAGTEGGDTAAKEVVGGNRGGGGGELGVARSLHGSEVVVIQVAHDGAVVCPGRGFVSREGGGIDVNDGFAGEEVGGNGGRREGFHIGVLHWRTVEDALRERLHLGTDDYFIELAAVGKGVAADGGDVVGDGYFLQP